MDRQSILILMAIIVNNLGALRIAQLRALHALGEPLPCDSCGRYH